MKLTELRSVTVHVGARECKYPSAPGEVPSDMLSDAGSTPAGSTITHRYELFWFKNVFCLTIENAER